MSLKAFHLVFIIASLLLSVFVTLWSFAIAEQRHLALGALAILVTIGLGTYLAWFIKNLRYHEAH
jgi:VIT1/CCC1 family predicted Fe2+/Mn2+ transporter